MRTASKLKNSRLLESWIMATLTNVRAQPDLAENNYFPCSMCHKIFSSLEFLTVHMKKRHHVCDKSENSVQTPSSKLNELIEAVAEIRKDVQSFGDTTVQLKLVQQSNDMYVPAMQKLLQDIVKPSATKIMKDEAIDACPDKETAVDQSTQTTSCTEFMDHAVIDYESYIPECQPTTFVAPEAQLQLDCTPSCIQSDSEQPVAFLATLTDINLDESGLSDRLDKHSELSHNTRSIPLEDSDICVEDREKIQTPHSYQPLPATDYQAMHEIITLVSSEVTAVQTPTCIQQNSPVLQRESYESSIRQQVEDKFANIVLHNKYDIDRNCTQIPNTQFDWIRGQILKISSSISEKHATFEAIRHDLRHVVDKRLHARTHPFYCNHFRDICSIGGKEQIGCTAAMVVPEVFASASVDNASSLSSDSYRPISLVAEKNKTLAVERRARMVSHRRPAQTDPLGDLITRETSSSRNNPPLQINIDPHLGIETQLIEDNKIQSIKDKKMVQFIDMEQSGTSLGISSSSDSLNFSQSLDHSRRRQYSFSSEDSVTGDDAFNGFMSEGEKIDLKLFGNRQAVLHVGQSLQFQSKNSTPNIKQCNDVAVDDNTLSYVELVSNSETKLSQPIALEMRSDASLTNISELKYEIDESSDRKFQQRQRPIAAVRLSRQKRFDDGMSSNETHDALVVAAASVDNNSDFDAIRWGSFRTSVSLESSSTSVWSSSVHNSQFT